MATTVERRGSKFELDPGKAPRRDLVTNLVSHPIHTISLLVRNKPGVLVRVALIFSRRGYFQTYLGEKEKKENATPRSA